MTRTEAVAAYLKARPQMWVDGRELALVGGFYAFRTRVSDARQQFGMQIENRVRRLPNGLAVSEYRYLPPPAVGQSRLWGDGDAA